MSVSRRSLLKHCAVFPVISAVPSLAPAADPPPGKADYELRIATGLVELSPRHIVSTTLYNGQFPGPLVRLTEGKRVVVDIHNDTDTPEQLHWHGQFVPVDVDGAAEEGTPYIPARGMRRVAFVPKPSGFRFYHTHVVPMNDLTMGTYTGQAGPVYVEPIENPGAYDREIFLTLKEFLPSFSRGGDMTMDFLAGTPINALQDVGKKADNQFHGPKGYEVGYDLFSINGKMLGHGEPIRVKPGDRVLFHILNASAGEIRSLALPGHVFRIVALDGSYLAFLGRISPEKRPDRAIRIARAAGIPLKLAAKVDKVDEHYFRNDIAPLIAGGGVEFIGEINEREKTKFLGEAAALLFPIDWPEPFGLVMIESMACGTPVLAFRHGSVAEVIDDGVTGKVVESEEEAVAVLPALLAYDRRKVRQRFEERFTATRMAEDYVNSYRQLLKRRMLGRSEPKGPRGTLAGLRDLTASTL